MTDYCFRANVGITIGNVTAQVIGETLADIEDRHGVIDPHTVVDESRPDDAPLHPVFEWRDEIAAEHWRVEQARRVVRSVEIITEDRSSATQIAYVNIQSMGGYVSSAVVHSEPDLYEEAIEASRGRLQAAAVQMKKVEELAPIEEKARIRKNRLILEEMAAA